MLTRIVSTLGGWLPFIQWGVIAGLVGYGLYLVDDYKSLSSKNATLRAELSSKKNELEVVKTNKKIADDTIMALDARLAQKSGDLSDFAKQIDAIQKECEGNEPVGGTLGKTLESLKEKAGQK